MNPRQLTVIIAAFSLGCGTVQHSMEPGREALVDGFPSEPYPQQKRPGKDGRCSNNRGPPAVIIKGGACWVWVVATPEECEQLEDYAVLYQGKCYYPLFILNPQREPTSTTPVVKGSEPS
jgi:hypothetical protein